MTLQESDYATLRQRVERLEKQGRRYKQLGVVILVLAACAVFMAEAKPMRVLEASSFILRDEGGHTRATLGMSTEDNLP